MINPRIYRTARPDGRYRSTMGFCHSMMKSLKPKLAFDPGWTAEALRAWQGRVRSRLRDLMAFPETPPQPPPVRISSEAREGYRLEKWEAFPEPGSVVPYLVLIPDEVSETRPAPAVMCFTGSAHSKELLAGEPELDGSEPETAYPVRNRMAFHYVRAGLIAVAVENPGTAELDERPISGKHPNTGRDKLCGELLMMGRHYLGLSVFQKLHILGWLRGLPWVDSRRIALSGHSLGTEPAMVMAVLEPDIRALVFNDFLCSNQERYVTAARPPEAWRHISGLWHLVPGLLEWFDFPDLLASLAPRPLLITEGGATHNLERVARAYEVLDARIGYEYHYYPKYARAEDRKHEGEVIPEGVTDSEWFEYVNVDVPDHSFREGLAVPWLARQVAGPV